MRMKNSLHINNCKHGDDATYFLNTKLLAYAISRSHNSDNKSINVVGPVTRLKTGLGNRGSLPGKDRTFFFLHHKVHTGCGAHPASYPTVTRSSCSKDKAAGP
jgi:hypothetical protein